MTMQRKTKLKILLILAITSAISSTLFLSCKNTQIERKIDTAVYFPSPIDENGNQLVTIDENFETVSMPLYYWLKIVNYVIDTQPIETLKQ